ncbi:MAG: PepSY-associated TM helix domain-containing protein [Bacteroidales bacterium]|nr:PepSY-associated TM helix domain-containing protein [Bacteroidales bacterium]
MNIRKVWRKWFRILHRDLGFIFFGMTIIYSLSGIAINHLKDWNPNYIIETKNFDLEKKYSANELSREEVIDILSHINQDKEYKKHFYPSSGNVKVFLKGGSVLLNLKTGKGYLELIKRRPLFNDMNYLHYNPIKWWTWFSDIFAVGLILLAITGLFLIKGKKGLKGRGGLYTAIGIIIPIIFLMLIR